MLSKLLILLFSICSVANCGCYNSAAKSKLTENKLLVTARSNFGDNTAPDFTLYTLDGEEVRLSDYLGKVVIIDFWATWCAPCRKGIPDLVSIQNEFKDDLVVIGISLDPPATQDELAPFIKQYGINYPVVLGNIKVSDAYGNIQAIPTSFIIDQEGNIINKHIGLVPKSKLLEEINSLLSGS
jgi:peroxiredoxin